MKQMTSNPTFEQYQEKSKINLGFLLEQLDGQQTDNFRARFKISSHSEKSKHPLIFDDIDPLTSQDTEFSYEPGWAYIPKLGHHGPCIFSPDPLDDIELLVRKLNPGYLQIQSVDNELFHGHLAGLYTPDQEKFEKIKGNLLEFGFSQCFKNIYK